MDPIVIDADELDVASGTNIAMELVPGNPPAAAVQAPPATGSAVEKPCYQCRIDGCNRTFSTPSNRSRHEKTHDVGGDTPHQKCDFCDKVFGSVSLLSQHAATCRSVPSKKANKTKKTSTASVTASSVSSHNSVPSAKSTELLRTTLKGKKKRLKPVSAVLPDPELASSNLLGKRVHSMMGSYTAEEDNDESQPAADPDQESPHSTDSDSPDSEPSQQSYQSISDEELMRVIGKFIEWLSQGSHTVFEQVVKKKRVTTTSQLRPVVTSLKFIVSLMVQHQLISMDDLHLNKVIQLDKVQKLFEIVRKRGVGAGRIHALSLLLKKVCVFICSSQSLKTNMCIMPQSIPSYCLLESICEESGKERKMVQSDKRVLQISSERDARFRNNKPKPYVLLTKDHLKQIVETCMQRLEALGKKLSVATGGGSTVATRKLANQFTSYLITVSFVLLLAPRQQVLRQVVVGQSLVKGKDGAYSITLRSHQTKNGKAVLLRVPASLTPAYDLYLSTVRPLLVDAALDSGALFIQRGQANRGDFSAVTKQITQSILGFPVNSHSFRHAIASTFHESTGSNDKVMRDLAMTMNHDLHTQQQYYVHFQHLESQVGLQNTLSSILAREETKKVVVKMDLPD
jgi:hypothetical protein